MFSIKLLYLICATSVSVHCSNDVPLLAWGQPLAESKVGLSVPALQSLSTSQFSDNILKKVARNEPDAVMVFLEESLSSEDLRSRGKATSFPHIERIMKTDKGATFVPRVESVEDALNTFKEFDYQIVDFNPKNLKAKSKTVFIMRLNDLKEDETRDNLLKRHDRIVYENCKLAEETIGNTVCIYSASRNSWIEPELSPAMFRKLLQAEDEVTDDTAAEPEKEINAYYSKKSNIALVYTKTPPIFYDLQKNSSYNLTSVSAITVDNKSLRVSLNDKSATGGLSKITLTFVFSSDPQNWKLENIKVEVVPLEPQKNDTLTSNLEIKTSLGYSFHTPSKVVFKNGDYKLVFDSLQVEFFNYNRGSVYKFDVADDTVYFFTIPILSGLFVTSLLVTIVLMGLSVMFDIKTNDLFDDPKGKTVTINASD